MIFKNTLVIATFSNDVLTAGQHVFPFSIDLPPVLVQSFCLFILSNNTEKLVIRYKLTAKIMNDSNNQK